MRKFVTVLIGCSLALVTGAGAAQKDQKNKQKPKGNTAHVNPQQAPRQHVAPKKNVPHQNMAPNQHMGPTKQHTAPKQHAPRPDQWSSNAKVPHNTRPNPNLQNNDVARQQLDTQRKIKSHKMAPVQPNTPPMVKSNQFPNVQSPDSPKIRPNQPNQLPAVQANKKNITRVETRHHDFKARPSTTVASVNFNQNYRIRNANNWQGHQYNVFRTYRPQWHDRNWWHSHHNHIVLIGGGWYFWNAGYWFPAWGYDPGVAYYPYDGPIYVGSTVRPFDQVVADVQSILQEQGYYRGEVDGLVGPLTQEALASYQRDQGLVETAAIDEPTLDSLGLT